MPKASPGKRQRPSWVRRGTDGAASWTAEQGPLEKGFSRRRRCPEGQRRQGPAPTSGCSCDARDQPPLEDAAGRGLNLVPGEPRRQLTAGGRSGDCGPQGCLVALGLGVWLEPSNRGAAAGRVERSPSQAGRKLAPRAVGNVRWLTKLSRRACPNSERTGQLGANATKRLGGWSARSTLPSRPGAS